jgi:hypothetical protein
MRGCLISQLAHGQSIREKIDPYIQTTLSLVPGENHREEAAQDLTAERERLSVSSFLHSQPLDK